MKMKKRFLSILLSLVLVLGMFPGMSLTAYADGDPYASIKNTTTVVHFDSKDWYLIDYDSSTVTLLAKECVAASQYNSSGSFVEYSSNPTVKTAVDNYYTNNITADAKTAVSDGGMFLLTTAQANAITNADVRKCTQYSGTEYNVWWLCSQGRDGNCAAFVRGENGYVADFGDDVGYTVGVRPALKLDLSKVAFDSATKTFSLSVSYPLWVGGTQVTSANANNIDGDGKANYDAETQTLKLNNYSYSGEGSTAGGASGSTGAITTSENLNIVITGTNSVKGTTFSGIYVKGNLTISGTGSLTAEGKENGICNEGGIKISSGTITAIGSSYAIFGSLRNDIAGTGWTDTEGTLGKANIAISDTGRYFTNYKKIQFPEVKDPAKVTTTPKANDLTYNGQAQELVTAGTAEGGTMYYALGENATTAPADNLYTTSIPAKTDAGTYYVWYKVKGDDGYSDTEAKCIEVTISRSNSSPAISDVALPYTGQPQELVTAGTVSGGTLQYALGTDDVTPPAADKWSTEIPTGTEPGKYYVWYMVKGDANHNDTKPACVEATIAKKELTVTAEAKSKTVGEADPALTYTAEGLVGSDALSGALSRDAGEAAGTYQITQGTLTAGDNYAITFIPAVLTIQEAPSSGGGGGGGGVYYGGGTVSSQPQAPYSQVIGATATSYGDSSPERIHNIELACEKLNGIIVEPGEVFSFNEAIGSLTADSGFEIAPVYPGDEATAVMGGGVSQVASTLYASSLFGLLETIERSNHEYAVPFAQAGVDADVSNPAEGGGLDLKFRNSRSEPIKIVVTSKVDEAKKLREITVELRSVLSNSDYMPVRFDNSKSGEKDGVLFADVLDPTRPGYRIVLDHEEQSFTDANGSGIRTLTHRKILDAGGWLVKDEILNARLPDGSYAMDTYYTKG